MSDSTTTPSFITASLNAIKNRLQPKQAKWETLRKEFATKIDPTTSDPLEFLRHCLAREQLRQSVDDYASCLQLAQVYFEEEKDKVSGEAELKQVNDFLQECESTEESMASQTEECHEQIWSRREIFYSKRVGSSVGTDSAELVQAFLAEVKMTGEELLGFQEEFTPSPRDLKRRDALREWEYWKAVSSHSKPYSSRYENSLIALERRWGENTANFRKLEENEDKTLEAHKTWQSKVEAHIAALFERMHDEPDEEIILVSGEGDFSPKALPLNVDFFSGKRRERQTPAGGEDLDLAMGSLKLDVADGK